MEKILIIDDEPDICQGISEFLKDVGFETLTATRGKDGLTEAFKNNPDLIILDIALPDMDGTAVYETLRQDPRTKNVHVIFLTALATGAPQQYVGIDRIGYTLLSKPIRFETILEEIKRVLSKH